MKKRLTAKSAGAIVFTIQRGNILYLILKHDQAGQHWGFPKGTALKREGELQNARREIYEETGISDFQLIKPFKEIEKYSFTNKNGLLVNKKVVYFLAYTIGAKTKLSEEHSQYYWGTYEQIMSKLSIKSYKKILTQANKKLIRILGYKKSREEVSFVSFPKAGRTWITVLISRILQKKFNLKESYVVNLEKMLKKIKSLPRITIKHEDDPHLKDIPALSKNKLKYCTKKIILLARDPRDMIVSFYFHQSKRKGNKNYKKSISEFLFEKKGGFDVLIEYYNLWEKNKDVPKDFLLVKYEDFKAQTEKQVKKILNFMNIKNIPSKEIKEAIKYASFENMKKMEAENRFKVKLLMPGNVLDSDSYKVRRGIIGGYKDYLTKKDIIKLNKKMQNLSDFYGYTS